MNNLVKDNKQYAAQEQKTFIIMFYVYYVREHKC